jgi:hypothetical protein
LVGVDGDGASVTTRVAAENGGFRILISVSSGLHKQAWKKGINGGSHLIVDDDAGRDSA